MRINSPQKIQLFFKSALVTSLLTSVVLLINGCVGQPSVPQDFFYRLPVIHPDKAFDTKLIHGAIAVDQLDADGVYRERPLLYVDAQRPLEVLQYHYRHWIQIPSQLIQDNLVDYLREANIADRVERYTSGRQHDFLIKGRLHKFERLVEKDRSIAVVQAEIEFRKRNQQGVTKITKIYESDKTAQGETIHDTVSAFGEALRQIYKDMLSDIKSMEN
ncbi:ABC-type transport auxiliary lipoprotein family protein [Kaarinaea lacus]